MPPTAHPRTTAFNPALALAILLAAGGTATRASDTKYFVVLGGDPLAAVGTGERAAAPAAVGGIL